MTQTGIEIARSFAELVLEEREVKASLADIKSKQAALSGQVEAFLLESGLKNLPFEDIGITIYTQESLWATPKEEVERGEILTVLEGCGWDAAISYNANTLSALVREAIREGHPIPKELDGLIDVKTRVYVKGKATT